DGPRGGGVPARLDGRRDEADGGVATPHMHTRRGHHMTRDGAPAAARVLFRAHRLMLALTIGATLVALRPPAALAVCGDGVLDPGDGGAPTAPPGACPNSCVPAGFADACTCATPWNGASDYVLIAGNNLRLGTGTEVTSGYIAIDDAGGYL